MLERGLGRSNIRKPDPAGPGLGIELPSVHNCVIGRVRSLRGSSGNSTVGRLSVIVGESSNWKFSEKGGMEEEEWIRVWAFVGAIENGCVVVGMGVSLRDFVIISEMWER